MNDYLVRGITMDGFVKMVAIRSTELVRRGCEIQKTTPNATAAFGRCLTAASMMGNMQKVDNGSMTLQIKGKLSSSLFLITWEMTWDIHRSMAFWKTMCKSPWADFKIIRRFPGIWY